MSEDKDGPIEANNYHEGGQDRVVEIRERAVKAGIASGVALYLAATGNDTNTAAAAFAITYLSSEIVQGALEVVYGKIVNLADRTKKGVSMFVGGLKEAIVENIPVSREEYLMQKARTEELAETIEKYEVFIGDLSKWSESSPEV